MADRTTHNYAGSPMARIFLVIAASLLCALFTISTVASIQLGQLYAALVTSLLAVLMAWIAYRGMFTSYEKSHKSAIADRLDCPCCGYPTLEKTGKKQFCRLCNWESIGTSDEEGAILSGKTNGGYSVSAARKNFETHRDIYLPRADVDLIGVDPRIGYELKGQLMAAFDAWGESSSSEQLQIEKRILELEDLLVAEVDKYARALSETMGSNAT